MELQPATERVLSLLREKGLATNKAMIRLLAGDGHLFEEVREELILLNFAKDKDGVGLVYTGAIPVAHSDGAPVIPAGSSSPETTTQADPIVALPKRIFLSYGRADASSWPPSWRRISRLKGDHHDAVMFIGKMARCE